MNRILIFLTAVLFAFVTAAGAAETTKSEKRLDSSAASIDKDSSGAGEKVVVERLEKEFKVDDARIKSLRDKKLGYGEIAIALSLAEKMPGGITDENVNKIMAMRQGPPVEGWGKIAQDLGTKLGPVISRVEKVRSETHKDIKKAERGEAAEKKKEKGEKMEKHEKMNDHEKMEKPEKMERPERPEMPDRGGRK